MRADVFWSAVWGTCFVGGVLIGVTGPGSIMSGSPRLRGSGAAAMHGQSPSQLARSPVEREEPTAAEKLRNIEEAAPAIVDTTRTAHRTLASRVSSGDFDFELAEGGADGDQRSQRERSLRREYYGGRLGGQSKVAKRIHALNGGLWGPNEEEGREIAEEMGRLGDEDNTTPFAWPSSPSGEENGDELHHNEGVLGGATFHHSLVVSVHSFSYGFEDDDVISYDFSDGARF